MRPFQNGDVPKAIICALVCPVRVPGGSILHCDRCGTPVSIAPSGLKMIAASPEPVEVVCPICYSLDEELQKEEGIHAPLDVLMREMLSAINRTDS